MVAPMVRLSMFGAPGIDVIGKNDSDRKVTAGFYALPWDRARKAVQMVQIKTLPGNKDGVMGMWNGQSASISV